MNKVALFQPGFHMGGTQRNKTNWEAKTCTFPVFLSLRGWCHDSNCCLCYGLFEQYFSFTESAIIGNW